MVLMLTFLRPMNNFEPINFHFIPSRGGLVVEHQLHKKCHSATVGSNPGAVWHVNRSEEETPCRNSHCRAPGLSSDGFI